MTGHLYDLWVDFAAGRKGMPMLIQAMLITHNRQAIGLLDLADDGSSGVNAVQGGANLPDQYRLALDNMNKQRIGQVARDAGISNRRQRFDQGCVGAGVGEKYIDARQMKPLYCGN